MNAYVPSAAAREASAYYNSLPLEERQKLAPLLESYRQAGMAEALVHLDGVRAKLNARVEGIRERGS